jgi:hypothetical protein
MATRKKNTETVDCVQWDGLKETALAFFGMDVLENQAEGRHYFFNEPEGKLIEFFPDGALSVPIGWYLVKNENGTTRTMCEDLFNDQYEIIDEYPA